MVTEELLPCWRLRSVVHVMSPRLTGVATRRWAHPSCHCRTPTESTTPRLRLPRGSLPWVPRCQHRGLTLCPCYPLAALCRPLAWKPSSRALNLEGHMRVLKWPRWAPLSRPLNRPSQSLRHVHRVPNVGRTLLLRTLGGRSDPAVVPCSHPQSYLKLRDAGRCVAPMLGLSCPTDFSLLPGQIGWFFLQLICAVVVSLGPKVPVHF